ncbi:MAG TPA: flagellar basal body-associated FliL family protein [Acetobacteraceae bacterium]|nr:flagellar basal body-associated FliL family protein [Acetobacteraceae bacterium]
MAAAAPAPETAEPEAAAAEAESAKPASRLPRLLLLGVPLLLAALIAGLWFSGVLPRLLGFRQHAGTQAAAAPILPTYVDLPEIVANLNTAGRPSYVKLSARAEVAGPKDAERVRQLMPRIQDLFQTYLREMRPDELRGSAGSYRLREELLARANIAVAPAHINTVLFIQLLIQ